MWLLYSAQQSLLDVPTPVGICSTAAYLWAFPLVALLWGGGDHGAEKHGYELAGDHNVKE